MQYETSGSSNILQNCAQNLTGEKRREIAEYFLTRLFYGILKGLGDSGLTLSKPGNNAQVTYVPLEKDIGNQTLYGLPKPEIPGTSFETEILRSLEESLEDTEIPTDDVSEDQAKELAKYFLPKFLEKYRLSGNAIPDNFVPIEILFPFHEPTKPNYNGQKAKPNEWIIVANNPNPQNPNPRRKPGSSARNPNFRPGNPNLFRPAQQ